LAQAGREVETVNVTYSETADALYFRLTDGAATHAEEIDPGAIVDLDENDEVVGIEVLSPARDWPLDEIAERFPLSMPDHLLLRTYHGRSENKPFPHLPRRTSRRALASSGSR
jgi:uncharacterized protein YuzE